MAYRKTVVNRLVNNLRNKRLHAGGDCRSSTDSAVHSRRALNATDAGAISPDILPPGVLREKLMLAGGSHLRVECLFSPPPPQTFKLSAEDARRIVRMSMVKQLAMKLREVKENSISYEEFVRICVEGSGSEDQGSEMVKALNDSGEVFIVGNIVFLKPEQVTKSVHALIAQTLTLTLTKPDDAMRRQQLEKMEREKAEIDSLARSQVRSELFCGFGILLTQTIAAMKLTFWDLSWDVMEPVCFFAVSMHFIAAYTFFLRTSVEPTFEGYFQRRLLTKQRRLMVARNFDLGKYEELRWALYGPSREMGLAAQFRPNDIL